MATHELKTWPEPFSALWNGKKTFEYRWDDRGFKVLDWLYLREYDPTSGTYSGRRIMTSVTHMARGPEYGIPEGYCVMSLLNPRLHGDTQPVKAPGDS